MTNPFRQVFSTTQTTVVICLGVVSGCITAIQPLLLTGLVNNNQLLTSQIGQAATAESLGTAIAMTVAAARFEPNSLKRLAATALLLALAINLATGWLNGMAIVLLRAVHGMCSGVLLWILLGLISRSAAPGRIFAVYVSVQSMLSFGVGLLLSLWLLGAFGSVAGYLLIALIDTLLLVAVHFMPARYQVAGNSSRSMPPLRGLLGLLSVFFLLAGIISFWVYVIPLGQTLGHPAHSLNRVVSLAIGFQVLAGIFAVVFADRLLPFHVCLAGAILAGLLILLFMSQSNPVVLFASLGLYCFVWIAVPPFQMPLLIEIDPSLKSAMFIGTAQLFGIALGPLMAAQLLTYIALPAIAFGAIACLAISALLLIVAVHVAGDK